MWRRLVWLLLTVAGAASAAINKCCPAGQQLHPDLKSCIASDAPADFFQSHILLFGNETGGQFNMPCPTDESDALVFNSEDMNFRLDADTLDLLPSVVKGADRFAVDAYCIDKVSAVNNDTLWIAFTCPCVAGVCVRTCCGRGKVIRKASAHHDSALFCDSVTDDEWRHWSPLDSAESNNNGYYPLEAVPKCMGDERLTKLPILSLTIASDGNVSIETEESYEILQMDSRSCLGLYEVQNDSDSSSTYLTRLLLECLEDGHTPLKLSRVIIYTILFLIGAVFLLATIVVHLALPVLTKGVRGKGLVAHCASMFVAHIALIVVQLEGSTLSDGPCHFMAYLIQFTLLAGFFWLNVMCFDISMTFRSLQSMVPRGMLSERKQFAWYTVYAVGGPFIIFVVTISLNHAYRGSPDPDANFWLADPQIGISTCWFDAERNGILVFFYGPIGILLLINLTLFLFTTYKICKLSRAANMINQNDNSQRHNSEHKRTLSQKQRFILFLKLFGLMGIPWVFEIISWKVKGADEYWYFTDAINILRSVFIFTTFCCKRKVWRLLCEKYPKIKELALMMGRQPASNTATESSRSNPNESYAETMNGVSMETLAVDLQPAPRRSVHQ
ncbi:G-protein coupled receptor Mth-like isoform X1 [Cloeon dipterum]|uniref:G-protein coupled receptor Mth-like isoform X1 n=1 Tax=Cloeon dipterum TaxID=197152 RepID=UPI00321FA211